MTIHSQESLQIKENNTESAQTISTQDTSLSKNVSNES